MSTDQVIEFVAMLFIAYATGWSFGYLIYIFRRASDLI